jgi:hypothetical protein
MSVYRRRLVHRDSYERQTKLLGGISLVTATCTAAVAWGATASGSTPGLTGTVTTPVVVSFASISEASLEVSVPFAVAVTTTATGLQITPVSISTSVVFGVTTQTIASVTASVVWASSATVGSTFTMDVAAPVVWSVTPATQLGSIVSAATVFGFSTGIPEITDGTIETATTIPVAWSVTGTGSFGVTNNVPNAFFFDTVFNAELNTQYESSTVTVTGISVPTEAAVQDGEFSINGGDFGNDPVMVVNGDEVVAKHTSAETFSTSTVTTVIIGGVLGTFTSITRVRETPEAPRRNQLNTVKRRKFA